MTGRGVARAFVRVALAGLGLVVVLAALVHFGVVANPFGWTVSGDLAGARGSAAGMRVLFVGNSFTFRNDLPGEVRNLLNSDGSHTRVFIVRYTRPGGRLAQAARNTRLAHLIDEVHWDYVVLQEQSEIPSFPDRQREELMDGYARNLGRMIRASGATPVLFETWGYRNGDRRNVAGDDYGAMQQRLRHGYSEVAREINAKVAPVGDVWRRALVEEPNLALWARDGEHPSKLGTYLAACVFYKTLTAHNPTHVTYRDDLSSSGARFLRDLTALP
jgi:hypothetical protein